MAKEEKEGRKEPSSALRRFILGSINRKLIIILLLTGLIPVLLLDIFNIAFMKADMEREISNRLLSTAESKKGTVFAYIDSIESRTLDFSSDGFIRAKLKEIAAGNSSKAAEELSWHLIHNKKALDNSMAGILIIDLDGKVVAATDSDEIGEDESDDVYFIE